MCYTFMDFLYLSFFFPVCSLFKHYWLNFSKCFSQTKKMVFLHVLMWQIALLDFLVISSLHSWCKPNLTMVYQFKKKNAPFVLLGLCFTRVDLHYFLSHAIVWILVIKIILLYELKSVFSFYSLGSLFIGISLKSLLSIPFPFHLQMLWY